MASLTHPYSNQAPPPPPPGGPPPHLHRGMPPGHPGAYPHHGQAYPGQAYPPPYAQQPYPHQQAYQYPVLPGPPEPQTGPPPGSTSGALPPPPPGLPHGGPHPSHGTMHISQGPPAAAIPYGFPGGPMANPSSQALNVNASSLKPGANAEGHRRSETEEERRQRKKKEHEKREAERRREEEKKRMAGDTRQQQKGDKHGAAGQLASGAKSRHDKQRQAAPDGKPDNRLKRPTNFICKTRFTNELPQPVSAPKWLTVNQDADRYTKYTITSLERCYKHRLHVEPDLGIPLDLLDISAYIAPPSAKRPPLDPEDLELLQDNLVVPTQKKDTIKVKERPTDEGLNWLVHTQYIAPADRDDGAKKPARTEKEAKLLALQMELEEDGDLANDRDAQIRAVEESFRAAEQLPVHPTNPSLTPVEILPILPNLDRMGDQYIQLVFDTDPMEDSLKHRQLAAEARDHLEARALMKNFKMPATDYRPEQSFVAYMVPAVNEIGQEHDMDETVNYDWVREYHWTVTNNEAGRSSFLLCTGEDDVTFVPLNTKLTVRKLKAKEGKAQEEEEREEFPIPREVTVRKRDFLDPEEDLRDRTRRRIVEGDDAVEEREEVMQRTQEDEEDEEERSPRREEPERGSGGEEDSVEDAGREGKGEESGDEGYVRERSRSVAREEDEEGYEGASGGRGRGREDGRGRHSGRDRDPTPEYEDEDEE